MMETVKSLLDLKKMSASFVGNVSEEECRGFLS